MKRKITASAAALFVLLLSASLEPVFAEYNSSTNPASIGEPVRSMVELGSVYTNIYDIVIVVVETVRGRKAMAMLEKASPENGAPPEGYEYLLARVKFEMKGRAVSDTLAFDLGSEPLQWVALTSDLMEYPHVPLTAPKPALAGSVKSGDSMEGWVAFAVDKKDGSPVMVFDPDSGGATGRGRTLFFKLY